MNGIMNEIVNFKEYEFTEPLIQKIDSIFNKTLRGCHSKFFHTFDHVCEYDLSFTNITNNETVSFSISDKSMALYELNKKLTLARERRYRFNQILKLKIKIYSNLSHENIHYYLKLRIPIMHRHFLRKISQNPENIQKHIVMMEEILLNLRVVDGNYLIIHNDFVVSLHVFVYYYSHTCMNTLLSISRKW